MYEVKRRDFLKLLAASGFTSLIDPAADKASAFSNSFAGNPQPPQSILNEYIAYLPGEKAALADVPKALYLDDTTAKFSVAGQDVTTSVGDVVGDWTLLVVAPIDGKSTAVLEKHVTHRGAIAFVTVEAGTVALIPKWVGYLASIRPRQIAAPAQVQLRRTSQHVAGPDVPGNYILDSSEDPCYENVAALGPELIGWTLVANEQSGPQGSLYLEADGASRELNHGAQTAWAPDERGKVFDPVPAYNSQNWEYEKGYSKRTLLGGYLPVADIGVWNREYQCGYEAIALLPEGVDAKPMTRVRTMIPEDQIRPRTKFYRGEHGRAFIDRYTNSTPTSFFAELAKLWKKWNAFYEESMPVDIPDEWLLAGARAGITLCRCSCRGLEPTYQVGEGLYTRIPERSHPLFPVAEYEFIWAHQLWNLTDSSDKYFQFYLDKYVLPNGNFLYNTQDQVEAPFDFGMVLANSARGYFYEGNLDTLLKRLPVLRYMVDYVLQRYEYSKKTYRKDDPHYGLIWGSPEADYGDPHNDTPAAHPYYFENAAGVWRGLKEHGAALSKASQTDPSLAEEAARIVAVAAEMYGNIQHSLNMTLSNMSEAMKAAEISPFTPKDLNHKPTELQSYENHRYMQDWFLADFGDRRMDLGHLRHRILAGMQLCGMGIDGSFMRTSNFMAHGTLAVRIRQEDYRPFLLTLYGLACFASDSGNRYSPEDAIIPGGAAGKGPTYCWSSVVNSTLQTAMGLRWLLCYEESDRAVCHLQKAAPTHWFKAGEHIAVQRCPTRFGQVTWRTDSLPGNRYTIQISLDRDIAADLHLHIHSPNGEPLRRSSIGRLEDGYVVLDQSFLKGKRKLRVEIM